MGKMIRDIKYKTIGYVVAEKNSNLFGEHVLHKTKKEALHKISGELEKYYKVIPIKK